MKHAVRTAAVAAFAVLLSAAAAVPASAQTGSVWHDQKMFDMKSHDRNKAYDRRASEHYELGMAYAQTVQTLAGVEDRTPRQDKKLQKAYKRATTHLEEALDVEPDFVAARMVLGAIHFHMEEYEAARDAYQAVLAIEPENVDAKDFLTSVENRLERAAAASGGSGG